MLLLNFSVLCTRHLTRPEYGYLWPSAYRAKSVKQLWDVDNNIFSFYCKLVIKFPPHIVPQMCIAITLSLFSIHWRLLGWKSAFAIICSIAFGGFFCLGFFLHLLEYLYMQTFIQCMYISFRGKYKYFNLFAMLAYTSLFH